MNSQELFSRYKSVVVGVFSSCSCTFLCFFEGARIDRLKWKTLFIVAVEPDEETGKSEEKEKREKIIVTGKNERY